jgi:hypothetical protein
MKELKLIETRAELISRLEKDFFTEVDGYVYYYPTEHGYLTAHHLRMIADELDKRNKAWNDEINKYFEEKEKK